MFVYPVLLFLYFYYVVVVIFLDESGYGFNFYAMPFSRVFSRKENPYTKKKNSKNWSRKCYTLLCEDMWFSRYWGLKIINNADSAVHGEYLEKISSWFEHLQVNNEFEPHYASRRY